MSFLMDSEESTSQNKILSVQCRSHVLEHSLRPEPLNGSSSERLRRRSHDGRFMCSTASHSSPSSTTIRTRKKSRASSAGGDSVAVTRTAGDGSEGKSKGRSTKCNVRLHSGNPKNSRKTTKPSRGQRPNFGSLQNAVVLAPFYTLKRCFQTKLIDLYSYERMKKINQKSKLAKKRNMSFEYDIIELKPPSPPVKKEEKATKKQKEKSRSASYCQCKKDNSKNGQRLDRSSSKKVRKPSGGENLPSRVPQFSGPLKAKRRKLNPGIVTATNAKSCLPSGIDFYAPGDRFPFPEANLSFSAVSSRSKSDSWETYSNSPSGKEEHMQGSLAISTTSFDSYLEHFDKGSWHYSEPDGKDKRDTKSRREQEQIDADILPKPTVRNLIMQAERKSSDEEIVDFMDREPQTQIIPSVESNRHWQPLRRQSRTKGKKPERDSAAGYYLRSHSSSKEKDPPERSRALASTDRRECRSPCGNAFNKSKAFRIEVGIQVEGNGSEEVPGPLSSLKTGLQGSTIGAFCASDPRDETPEKPRCDSKPHLSDEQAQSPPRQSDLESSGESLRPPRIDCAEDQPGIFESERPEAGLNILGEHSDRSPMDLVADMRERLQQQAESHQPQDKESDYIFGARSSGNRLGESCEFSFGLKWVFSDDED